MTYTSPPIGNTIQAEFYNVPKENMHSKKIREALLNALKKENFTIETIAEVEFPTSTGYCKTTNNTEKNNNPNGYTVTAVLSESHAAIHTYPEYGTIVFEIYSCRGETDGRKTLSELEKKLKPKFSRVYERNIIVDPEKIKY